MKTFVIYFEDGSYFKCTAEGEVDALTTAQIFLGFTIERKDVKIISY